MARPPRVKKDAEGRFYIIKVVRNKRVRVYVRTRHTSLAEVQKQVNKYPIATKKKTASKRSADQPRSVYDYPQDEGRLADTFQNLKREITRFDDSRNVSEIKSQQKEVSNQLALIQKDLNAATNLQQLEELRDDMDQLRNDVSGGFHLMNTENRNNFLAFYNHFQKQLINKQMKMAPAANIEEEDVPPQALDFPNPLENEAPEAPAYPLGVPENRAPLIAVSPMKPRKATAPPPAPVKKPAPEPEPAPLELPESKLVGVNLDELPVSDGALSKEDEEEIDKLVSDKAGVHAQRAVNAYIKKLKEAGFEEVFIKTGKAYTKANLRRWLRAGRIKYGMGAVMDKVKERLGFMPMWALNNLEIDDMVNDIGKPLSNNYLGTVARDQISSLKFRKFPFGFIFNTSKENEQGRHWCAVFSDGESVELYNPLGADDDAFSDVLADLLTLLKAKSDVLLKVKINNIRHQNNESSSCGWFCIKFLNARMNGVSFKTITDFDHSPEEEKKLLKTFKSYL